MSDTVMDCIDCEYCRKIIIDCIIYQSQCVKHAIEVVNPLTGQTDYVHAVCPRHKVCPDFILYKRKPLEKIRDFFRKRM